MNGWQFSPTMNEAVARLAASDAAFQPHGRAIGLVAGLNDRYGTDAVLTWAVPSVSGPAMPANVVGLWLPDPGNVLLVKATGPHVVQTAAHEFAHYLVWKGLLPDIPKPDASPGVPGCDWMAHVYAQDAARFDGFEADVDLAAARLFAKYAPITRRRSHA